MSKLGIRTKAPLDKLKEIKRQIHDSKGYIRTAIDNKSILYNAGLDFYYILEDVFIYHDPRTNGVEVRLIIETLTQPKRYYSEEDIISIEELLRTP